MTAERIWHILKTEYGIENDEEFEAAAEGCRGIDIGLFTMPLLERSKTSEQKAKAEAETARKNSSSQRGFDVSLSQCVGV